MTYKTLGISFFFLLAGSLFACGGDDTGTGGSGGEPGQGGHAGSGGGTGGNGGSGGSNSCVATMGSPQAPVLQSVMPMDGALHIMWMNTTTDCDSIELDRNQDGGAFDVAYTLTCAATSQHDTAANVATSTYCYRVRCLKGMEVSPDSNELCQMP